MMLKLFKPQFFVNITQNVPHIAKSFYSTNSSIVNTGILTFNSKLFVNFHQQRYSSPFIYRQANLLWEGVTGPSTQVKKRARGKRRIARTTISLHRGRKIGENKLNIQWQYLGYDPAKDERKHGFILNTLTTGKKSINRYKPPLVRGWSGRKIAGQSLGKPVSLEGIDMNKFDSRVMLVRIVTKMNKAKGQDRRFNTLVAIGNNEGVIGIGKAVKIDLFPCLQKSKGKAMKNLEYFKLKEDRTIYHPIFKILHNTKMYARPLPANSGIVANYFITTLCKLVGIKDIYVKVEGAHRNAHTVTHLFLDILRSQESYQETADRLGLNVVEQNSSRDNCPIVLARPNPSANQDSANTISEYKMKQIVDEFLPYDILYSQESYFKPKLDILLQDHRAKRIRNNPFMWKHRNKEKIMLQSKAFRDLKTGNVV